MAQQQQQQEDVNNKTYGYDAIINVHNNNDREDDDNDNESNRRHDVLKKHPIFWSLVGVSQTLLTAGIVFGWASLLPVLREEGVNHTPQEFTTIFTGGAVGNYLSTIFFGSILDRYGPRTCGIMASTLFAIGLTCSSLIHEFWSLAIGITLLGFAGPGIQMPTLHFANLFQKKPAAANDEEDEEGKSSGGGGGGGGAAVYMSAQAAAFDGGTAVFAILRFLFQSPTLETSSSSFMRMYMVVPIWVFLTSIFVWPDDILETDDDDRDNEDNPQGSSPTKQQQGGESYVGPGSPYLQQSPQIGKKRRGGNQEPPRSLVNAPLQVVLKHPAFWSLAIWVSVHIVKLNFVVATINDQLQLNMPTEPSEVQHLIDIFGAMLPFGFVALPIVATLLETSTLLALQTANIVGLLYGGVLVWGSGLSSKSNWLYTAIVFPSVACSRQLVYSTIFHQIGAIFGFANYGTLLGITNLCVSSISAIQTPLVNWSETVGGYRGSNLLLWVLTVPLLLTVFWSDPSTSSSSSRSKSSVADENDVGESTPLNKKKNNDREGLLAEDSPTRRYSAV